MPKEHGTIPDRYLPSIDLIRMTEQRRAACSFLRSGSDFQATKDELRAAGFLTLQDLEIMPDAVLLRMAYDLGYRTQQPAEIIPVANPAPAT